MDGLHSTTLSKAPTCMYVPMTIFPTCPFHIIFLGQQCHPSQFRVRGNLERLSYNISNNQTIIKKQLCSHIRGKVKYFPTSDRYRLVSKKPHLHLGTYTTYLIEKRRPVRLLLFPRFDDDLAVVHPLDHLLLPTFRPETGHQRTR